MRQGSLRKALGFAARKPREAWLVARLAAWVAALSALVKFLPLPKALSIVSAAPRESGRAGGFTDERVAQLLDALLATDVLCFTPTCWKRATVLHRFLALGGRRTRIVFGMRKGGDDNLLAGHAWLEDCAGALFETTTTRPDYTVTYSFPSPRPTHELGQRT